MTDEQIEPCDAHGAWQPIETAPKDGTEVLVLREGRVQQSSYDRTQNYRNGKLERSSEYWTSSGYASLYEPEPTHWMSIPPLPVAPD